MLRGTRQLFARCAGVALLRQAPSSRIFILATVAKLAAMLVEKLAAMLAAMLVAKLAAMLAAMLAQPAWAYSLRR